MNASGMTPDNTKEDELDEILAPVLEYLTLLNPDVAIYPESLDEFEVGAKAKQAIQATYITKADHDRLVTEARIDENRIAWDWPRDKGLQYFEDRLQKRQQTLLAQLSDKEAA